MAAMNGRAVIIEMGATDLADELRTKTINFNGEVVNIETDGDDGWANTIDEVFNSRNVGIPLEGVLKGDTLSDMAFTGAHETFTITIGALFTLSGDWQFQAGFSIGAPYNGEVTFSGTLQSVGPITKAAVT